MNILLSDILNIRSAKLHSHISDENLTAEFRFKNIVIVV